MNIVFANIVAVGNIRKHSNIKNYDFNGGVHVSYPCTMYKLGPQRPVRAA